MASPDIEQSEPATGRRTPATEVGSVFVSNYPPYSFWSEEHVPDAVSRLRAPLPAAAKPPPTVAIEGGQSAPPNLGLYLHIPFCRKRCKFCYFRVYTDKNSADISRYLDALATEVELYRALPSVAGRPLDFVYFGGGTPSYISARHLRALVARLKNAFSWDEAAEVAFECEPGTLTQAKLEAIKEIGVTRLSLGVENLDDRILRENGRAHVSKEVYRVKPWIDQLQFTQVNVDLIAGMVGESWETWRDTVQRTIDLNPGSITIYQMELPFNTVYSRQLDTADGALELAAWNLKREWHAYAFEQLAQAGYRQSSAYTMVKSAATKFVYRDAVWQGSEMIGAGVASFSHLLGLHLQNTASWDSYLQMVQQQQLPLARALPTTPRERLIRELILQLKLGKIAGAYFREKFDTDIAREFAEPLTALEREGALRFNESGIELTTAGMLRVDQLLPAFYDPKYQHARYT